MCRTSCLNGLATRAKLQRSIAVIPCRPARVGCDSTMASASVALGLIWMVVASAALAISVKDAAG